MDRKAKEALKHRHAVYNAWAKKNSRNIAIRFSLSKDRDILEKLNSVENITEYIRNLIRRDIG